METKTAVAIDFGASRTKVAYWDPNSQKPQLKRFGQRNEPFMPSLFYLFRDSERILLGHDAEEMLPEDPAGIVEVLKRKLQERYVYANRRKESPQRLLAFLFSALREQIAGEVAVFQGIPPKEVFLTIPVLYGPATENLLKESALSAGFEKIELLQEPVAAAHAWLSETGETNKEVIVLDCGGGAVGWAYLRWDGNEYHTVPDCPPGGDTHVGGHAVDWELFNYLKSISEDERNEIEQKGVMYLREMRFLKERYCRGLPLRPLKIGSRPINLDEREVQSVIEERFVRQIIENLTRYLTRVKEISKGDSPVILFAGGSARIRGLKEAVELQCGCKTVWWENSEYATVLGAVPGVRRRLKPEVGELTKAQEGTPKAGDTWREPVTGMEFVWVPGGAFEMGDLFGDGEKDEKHIRTVRLAGFWLGKYEVTQGEWLKIMGKNPSHFKEGETYPVDQVSWDDTQEFVKELNSRGGGKYTFRLSSEAEWEYAARSGGKKEKWAGTSDESLLGEYAWYEKNSKGQTHPVGKKKPNGLGLYDMSGNVWEWCEDIYADDYGKVGTDNPIYRESGSGRVNRGGSWFGTPRFARASRRYNNTPDFRYSILGFRLARTP